MNNKRILSAIFLIIVIQSSFLFAMIAKKQNVLSSGTTVILETRPIDPRSLFRGDYIRLNYTINELKLKQLSGDKKFQRHDGVYIVLQKQQLYWQAVSIYHKKASLSFMEGEKDSAIIQGVVKSVSHKRWNADEKKYIEVESIRIRYGIENYFVPEGEGLKLERPEEGDKVTLEIALDSDGEAAIKTLLLNGEPQYQESLF
ncbi:MAG: GDYXXLXY domain-containing protein [gamma proteobacterium symbiont of Taylorina sp.]|nr:GDYXXLXY domain-containing protein [gamma proteobacterium symbiont of Taylorina sp.]